MLASVLPSFIHFLAAFAIAAVWLAEWALLQKAPDLPAGTTDTAAGQCLWPVHRHIAGRRCPASGVVREGLAFHSTQLLFHAKLALCMVIGLLSITTAVQFLRWRQDTHQGCPLPESELRKLRRWGATQLWLLPLLILCPAGVTRGPG